MVAAVVAVVYTRWSANERAGVLVTKHLRIDDFVVVNVVNTNLENIARRDCVTRATVAEATEVRHATGMYVLNA